MSDEKTAMIDPEAPVRLDASSKPSLAASIKALAPGRRGWISMAEAAHLFSAKDAAYAFGEMTTATAISPPLPRRPRGTVSISCRAKGETTL
jgi:hypothetical protein